MRLEGIIALLFHKPTLSTITPSSRCVLIQPEFVPIVSSVLKYSSISTHILHFLSFYDMIKTKQQSYTASLFYFFFNKNSTCRKLSAMFVIGEVVPTVEILWPGVSWQEREASEMLGVSFSKKRDSRSLFLLPIFLLTPLKKTFPTSGFYEITKCYFGGYSFTRLS